MFCNNCGTQLSDDSKYCYNCGTILQDDNQAPVVSSSVADAPANENVINTPSTAEAPAYETPVYEAPVNVAPAYEAPVAESSMPEFSDNPYNTPAPQAYSEPYPQAPQPPVYNQPYAAPQPPQANAQPYAAPQQGYYGNQPVQGYQAPNYNAAPVQPPVYQNYTYVSPTQPTTLNMVFSYITAGILGLMFILFLLPWGTAYGEGITMFTPFTDLDALEYMGLDGLMLCSLLTLVDMGMLIPGTIMAIIKRHNMPKGFVITSAVLTFIIVTFFAIFMSDSYYADATAVPYLAFFLSIASLVFSILARKK